MNEALLWLSWLPLSAGTFFFVAGTVGMLRFPDVYSRLHALTKADTLGLGMVVAGLCLRAQTWPEIPIMIFIWLLVVASGSTACQLLARYQREHDSSLQEDRRAQP
jgi:multicomponent Na+:H+ antiporter subunit G